MYPRIVQVRRGGTTYEYVRLVESYRQDGKNKQHTVLNLGRKDLLAPQLDALIRILSPDAPDGGYARVKDIETPDAWTWGPILAARTVWDELGLEKILDRMPQRFRGSRASLADRSFVLVANRLCAPSSEHRLARWLERDYVCDRRGRRWMPCWRDEEERRKSARPRVRVEAKQLQRWYRTLDELHASKPEIEKELYLQLRDLFSLEIELAFYDLTSTYFEGHGPEPLAAHGYSRDNRPRHRQVLVGVVMVDGWPLAHHVFRGNTKDANTVPSVLKDLQQRFGVRRVIFVGDRGMVTSANLALLRSKKQGYVVGLNRRRSQKIFNYIERTKSEEWIDCPVGITAREKANPPRTRVQEVPSDEEDVRVFVVESEERLQYERAEREKAMQKVANDLEKLQKRVEKGRLKRPEKVGAAAARALTRNHGSRYYDWEYRDGTFRYFEHPTNLTREKAYEGKYVIQTEEQDLSPLEAVQIYKSLSEVERGFRNLKDILELRPIYHQTEDRVEAHVFVAALAFLLQRAVERKLKDAGLDLSAPEALEALRTVRVVDIELGEGRTKRSVTRGSARCAPILRALGITDLNPPTPPEGEAVIQ